jgi:hypothetical protein
MLDAAGDFAGTLAGLERSRATLHVRRVKAGSSGTRHIGARTLIEPTKPIVA